MSLELSTLIPPAKTILPKIIEWIVVVTGKKAEAINNARNMLIAALSDTQNYVGRIKRGQNEDFAAREELAKKWNSAGAALDSADASGFALVCYQKADFWSGAGAWTKEELDNTDISLRSVIERLQKL